MEGAADGLRANSKKRRYALKNARFAPWFICIALGILLAGAIGVTGCGDDDDTTEPPEEFAPPTNLRATNGNEHVVLTWSASPDEGLDEFQRYNIYRGTTSLLGVDPGQLEQLGNKVGSVNAGVTTFQTTVANGTLYYFHVRAEKDDGGFSGATNEVQAAGRPEGEGVILEEFASEGDSGFDFSSGNTVSLAQDNPDRFTLTDVYLGTGDPEDDPVGVLSLKSPELLARLNAEWSNVKSTIKIIGTDWSANTTEATGFVTQFDVIEGGVYAVKTPTNNYAKLMVESIDGEAGSRSITFRFAFQTTPNLIQF